MATNRTHKREQSSQVVVAAAPALPVAADELMLAAMAAAGQGFEETDAAAFAIPFLVVLQALSPQCTRGSARFLPAARPGMLHHSVTDDLFDGEEGVRLVPAAYQRRFLRWGPRGTDSSGFKGALLPEAVVRMEQNGEVVQVDNTLLVVGPDGSPPNPKRCDRLADTRHHYCLLVREDDSVERVLLAMTSTQIRKSRVLMALLAQQTLPNGAQAPMGSNLLRACSGAEQNDQGSWFGWRITRVGPVPSVAVFEAAQAFWRSVHAGSVTPQHEAIEDGAEEAAF